MSYVPCNTWNGNKIFVLCAILAHNLTRELQMRHQERARNTTTKRLALWKFSRIDTLRKVVIQRAGRLIRPGSVLTSSLAANDSVRENLQRYLPNVRIVVYIFLSLCNTRVNHVLIPSLLCTDIVSPSRSFTLLPLRHMNGFPALRLL